MFPATVRMMEFLRERSRTVRRNNLRLHPWIEGYLDSCLMSARRVTILTQWCLSRSLERRFEMEGMFRPIPKELELWSAHVPTILSEFGKLGFAVDWFFTFNRGFHPNRRLAFELEKPYKQMIIDLAVALVESGEVGFFDWEEVLEDGPKPDPLILQNPEQYISQSRLEQEVLWTQQWMRNETDLQLSSDEIKAHFIFECACEAEEGRFLTGPAAPFGEEFLLVPLEVPEQYDFFCVFAPDFKKHIAAILPPYPWRLKSVEG